jgi:hypothetical protein
VHCAQRPLLEPWLARMVELVAEHAYLVPVARLSWLASTATVKKN